MADVTPIILTAFWQRGDFMLVDMNCVVSAGLREKDSFQVVFLLYRDKPYDPREGYSVLL